MLPKLYWDQNMLRLYLNMLSRLYLNMLYRLYLNMLSRLYLNMLSRLYTRTCCQGCIPEHVAKAVYLNMLPRPVPEHVAKAGT
jgi:hypothetical protein